MRDRRSATSTATSKIDHNEPVEAGGVTAIWNINRLCHHHHRCKTAGDLRIVGEGTHKVLVPGPRPPPDP